YDQLAGGLKQYTDPNYSTLDSPAVKQALSTIQSDVTNQVNGSASARGRFGSGLNQQLLARGIAQGRAPVILDPGNRDTATRIGALNNIYGAGNTTSGAISGLTQLGNTNQQAGIGAAQAALDARNWGPQQILEAQELGQRLPIQNLGLLANIGIPLAQ